jgi:hypothetical protein
MLPLFGFVGAVAGLTAMLARRTKSDEERWTLDRRKRERRDTKHSLGLPPTASGERRHAERRRAASAAERG